MSEPWAFDDDPPPWLDLAVAMVVIAAGGVALFVMMFNSVVAYFDVLFAAFG